MCNSTTRRDSRNEHSAGNQLHLDNRTRTGGGPGQGEAWRAAGGALGEEGTGPLGAVRCCLPGAGGSCAHADSELTPLVRYHHLWLSRTESGHASPSGRPLGSARPPTGGHTEERTASAHTAGLYLEPNLQTAFGFVTSPDGRTNGSLPMTLPEKGLSWNAVVSPSPRSRRIFRTKSALPPE